MEIGVLIIGSLYWDNGQRQAWRDSRLRLGEEFAVRVPIRYGRKSRNRGNTFTMVFSGGCPAGQAKAVRCRNIAVSLADLISEAHHLWSAESGTSLGQLSASWGCVGLLVNPRANIPQEIPSGWAAAARRESNYGEVPQAPTEPPLVDDNGRFNIPWPSLVGSEEPVPFDLLLATATHPTLEGNPPSYPDPRMIVEAWGNDPGDHIAYFRRNRENGICTFEDEAILREVRQSFPRKANGLL